MFISNCFVVPARDFIIGNKEIKSKEGTKQGKPDEMGAYALVVTPFFHFLNEFIVVNEQRCKEVAFANNFSLAGKIREIKPHWEMLQ